MQKKSIKLGGRKVKYLYGGTGRPLLFLHGWSTSPPSHLPSLKLLSRKFTVYAPFLYDLKFANVEGMAESIALFMKKTGLKKCVVAGTLFGSMLAAMVSVINPGSVSKLILINSAGLPIKASKMQMAMDALLSVLKLVREGEVLTVIHRWLAGARFHFSFLRKEFRELSREMQAMKKISGILIKVKVKTALIWSDRDVTFPLDYAKQLHKKIKNSALVIVNGTHAWQYHSPKLFAETIMRLSLE